MTDWPLQGWKWYGWVVVTPRFLVLVCPSLLGRGRKDPSAHSTGVFCSHPAPSCEGHSRDPLKAVCENEQGFFLRSELRLICSRVPGRCFKEWMTLVVNTSTSVISCRRLWLFPCWLIHSSAVQTANGWPTSEVQLSRDRSLEKNTILHNH